MALATGLFSAAPSFAQTVAANTGGGIQEVVVTARRQAENAINVPITIESFTNVQMERSGLTGLRDLAAMTPGLTFQDVNGAYSAPVIRGMEQLDQTSLQGNVGVFLDGIYLNNRSSLEFGLLDIDRLEVDKGPQSALYGRNAFSGAINYVTVQPNLHKITGNLSVEGGDYGLQTYTGAVNVPVVPDYLAVRAFGGWSKFNGTTLNLRDNQDIGGYTDKFDYGLSVLFKPTNELTVKLYGYFSRLDSNAEPLYAEPITANNCGSQDVRPNGTFYTLFCGNTPKITSVNVNDTIGKGTSGQTGLVYGTVDYKLPFADFTATLSNETGNYSNLIDTTALPSAISTPATAFPGYSNQSYVESVTPLSTDKSLDIRLASLPGTQYHWLVGVYGYDQDLENITQVSHQLLNQPNSTPVPFSTSGGKTLATGRAFYASIGYDFTSKLSATAETRYTNESQKFTGLGTSTTVVINGQTVLVQGQQSFGLWAPRFTANYKFTPDIVGYVSAAEGQKTGGFNSNGFTQPAYFAFKAENNWTYELGVKSVLLDRKLRLNADVFYVDWDNLQGQRYIPGTISTIVTNLGGATSTGIEMDAEYFFTRDLSARLTASHVDPKYKNGFIDGDVSAACGDLPGDTVINIACSDSVGGKQMARTAEDQFDISGNWNIPDFIPGYSAYLRGDFSYTGPKYTTGLDNNSQNPIELANARLGVTHGPFEIAIWSKNLFDYQYVDRVTITGSTADGSPLSGINYIRVYPGQRRTFGARLDYRF
jgi:iron complex outermembrane receptor protein